MYSSISLSMLNSPFLIILFLLMLALISPAEAQTVPATCTASSPQCCWVVRIWQLLGKTTSVSSTSSTACCKMSGVVCSGSTVTELHWDNQGFSGFSIPPDIGNLTDLIGM
jgi:hypothetical protein